ncbi:unnamed protein product [Trichobilharzia szidati]|nr:unnamed protein product [Trichobilharzia szidati]
MLNPIGQCDENFRQRQSDVFAALANLEAAHLEVYKATKEERRAVRKSAWRHTTAAPENLEEEKQRRENNQVSSSGEDRRPPNPTFRKPLARPPVVGHRARLNPPLRDPNKWTHYSLADIDEDAPISRELHYQDDSDANDSSGIRRIGGDPNGSIAMALINELRQRRNTEDNSSDCNSNTEDLRRRNCNNNRILFRPTKGRKKARLDDVDEESSLKPEVRLDNICIPKVDDKEDDDDGCDGDEPQQGKRSGDLFSTTSSATTVINEKTTTTPAAVFVNRRCRQKGQLRVRHTDDMLNESSVGDQQTDHDRDDDDGDVEFSDLKSTEHDDLIDSDEMEEDPEEDKSNDYFA